MTLLEVSETIDQLHSEAREISPNAAKYLALAWWHAEAEHREETMQCSTGHAIPNGKIYAFSERSACECCRYFQSLTNQAQLHRVA